MPGSHTSNLEAPFTFERGLPHAPGRGEPIVPWEGLEDVARLREEYQGLLVELNPSAGDVVICASFLPCSVRSCLLPSRALSGQSS